MAFTHDDMRRLVELHTETSNAERYGEEIDGVTGPRKPTGTMSTAAPSIRTNEQTLRKIAPIESMSTLRERSTKALCPSLPLYEG